MTSSDKHDIPFRPTPDASRALDELVSCHAHMEGFREGPYGENRLSDTEAAIWAVAYEVRRLSGDVHDENASERLTNLWSLLTDGVLRSLVLSRGGVDWAERS